MWRDSPCGGYHFWLIPSNGGKFEIIAYTHVVFKLMSTPLIFLKQGLAAKLENIFLHQKLSYSRYIEYFITQFGTSPHEKLSRCFADCRPFE